MTNIVQHITINLVVFRLLVIYFVFSLIHIHTENGCSTFVRNFGIFNQYVVKSSKKTIIINFKFL